MDNRKIMYEKITDILKGVYHPDINTDEEIRKQKLMDYVQQQVSGDFAELYWKHRCEAAELFIAKSPCDPDITEEQIKAYAQWKKLCDIQKIIIVASF